jgi:hypothetical protein
MTPSTNGAATTSRFCPGVVADIVANYCIYLPDKQAADDNGRALLPYVSNRNKVGRSSPELHPAASLTGSRKQRTTAIGPVDL